MPNSPATPGSTEPRRTILLAEDNVATAEMTAEVISHFGYNVVVARDGLEAITCARQHQPSLILMDVQMPVMNGLEATGKIIAKHGSPRPQIVALTANATREDRTICLAAGMDDYMVKPLRRDRLATVIEETHARKHGISVRN